MTMATLSLFNFQAANRAIKDCSFILKAILTGLLCSLLGWIAEIKYLPPRFSFIGY